jgi:hypothetical protein
MRRPLLIQGMWGLGDNVFARPFVRAACERYDVFLETPWPELYEDLPIKFVRLDRPRKLRTQQKNVAKQPAGRWVEAPRGRHWLKVSYGQELKRITIVEAIAKKFALFGVYSDLRPFDLPAFAAPFICEKPVAVIRPATIRTEWLAGARNPEPQYLEQISEALADSHEVVVVADLADGHEMLVGRMPFGHRYYVRGELGVTALLGLVRAADVVIGGVGWIVPVSIAYQRKAFIVLGGLGGHNHPNKITDPRMDLSRIGFAYPRSFCLCTNPSHSCVKTIPNLMQQFAAWARRVDLTLSLPRAA